MSNLREISDRVKGLMTYENNSTPIRLPMTERRRQRTGYGGAPLFGVTMVVKQASGSLGSESAACRS